MFVLQDKIQTWCRDFPLHTQTNRPSLKTPLTLQTPHANNPQVKQCPAAVRPQNYWSTSLGILPPVLQHSNCGTNYITTWGYHRRWALLILKIYVWIPFAVNKYIVWELIILFCLVFFLSGFNDNYSCSLKWTFKSYYRGALVAHMCSFSTSSLGCLELNGAERSLDWEWSPPGWGWRSVTTRCLAFKWVAVTYGTKSQLMKTPFKEAFQAFAAQDAIHALTGGDENVTGWVSDNKGNSSWKYRGKTKVCHLAVSPSNTCLKSLQMYANFGVKSYKSCLWICWGTLRHLVKAM